MSQNLKKCLQKLVLFANVKNKKVKNHLLTSVSCNDDIFCALQEIARNTVKRNIKLNRSERKMLKKYQKKILALSFKTKDKNKRKKLVLQSGEFIGALLPALITTLGPFVAELLAK